MYNYKEGKKRVKEILNNRLVITEQNELPNDDSFTFDNAYKSWVSAIFVDIRNSTELFTRENKEEVSKIIRSFTSEIIEILRLDNAEKPHNKIREIGIRGDCVYAIYTTPFKDDIYDLADKSFYINTYIKMLNKLLLEKNFSKLKVGIGVSTAQELVVKSGRKNTGINNAVWIGSAVTIASKLSGIAAKNDIGNIAFSKNSYDNFIEEMKASNTNGNVESWFSKEYNRDIGYYYHCDVIKTEFNNWIEAGML